MSDLLRVFALCVLTIVQIVRLKWFDKVNLAGSMSLLWQLCVFICIRQFNPWAVENYVESGNYFFMLMILLAEVSIIAVACYILTSRYYRWQEKKSQYKK